MVEELVQNIFKNNKCKLNYLKIVTCTGLFTTALSAGIMDYVIYYKKRAVKIKLQERIYSIALESIGKSHITTKV